MATKALMISIPNPCSENWNNMTPQEKGRFCDACQKCVVDFTAMTDAAVLDFFNKNNGKICGRFDKQQLDRVLIINDKRFQKRFNIAASLLFLSSLGFSNSVRNETVMPLRIPAFYTQNNVVKKPFLSSNEPLVTDRITISGNIFAAENPKEPLVGAYVSLKGTTISVVAGIDGDFAFTVLKDSLKDAILVVLYAGYETQELNLSKLMSTEHLVVSLKEGVGLSGEVMIVKRPNLWMRFTNLFKRKNY